jgi:hypothetical protein
MNTLIPGIILPIIYIAPRPKKIQVRRLNQVKFSMWLATKRNAETDNMKTAKPPICARTGARRANTIQFIWPVIKDIIHTIMNMNKGKFTLLGLNWIRCLYTNISKIHNPVSNPTHNTAALIEVPVPVPIVNGMIKPAIITPAMPMEG